MPVYIVSVSDYDTYDPHYVSSDREYTRTEWFAFIDTLIPEAALALLAEREAEVEQGKHPWLIDWAAVVGRVVDLLCTKHGFLVERPVEANYCGGIIKDRCCRNDRGDLIPQGVVDFTNRHR